MYFRKYYLSLLLISSFVIVVFAAWAKLTHAVYAENIMTLAFVTYGALIVLMINKILSSFVLNGREKLLWILITLLGGYLGIALYLLMVEEKKVHG